MFFFYSHKLSFIRLIPAILVIALCSSCSIKEDRSDCPCRLSLIFPDGTKNGINYSQTLSIRTSVDQNQYTFHSIGKVEIKEHIVPRGFTSVSVVSGVEEGSLGVTSVTSPSGRECDRLFAYSSLVDCRSEVVSDTVRLHKQYCALGIELAGSSPLDNVSVVVSASYNSMDIYTLSPTKGEYGCLARKLSSDSYEVLIPRQGKGDFVLTILDSADSSVITTFDMNPILEAAHFDWHKDDIDDIKLTLDIESSEISLIIEEWRPGTPIVEIF